MKCELVGMLADKPDGDFGWFEHCPLVIKPYGGSHPICFCQKDEGGKLKKFFDEKFPDYKKVKITIETIE